MNDYTNSKITILRTIDEISKRLDILDKKLIDCQNSLSNERQNHGFKYEDYFLKLHNLQGSSGYTSEFDGYNGETPIQIKYIGAGNEICLGDYMRNGSKSDDFILHIAFYDKKNIYPNIEEYTLYIDHKVYNNLFVLMGYIIDIKNTFASFSNDKSADNEFTIFRDKWNTIGNRGVVHARFKRDHKKQKRLQAAIPYNKLQEFLKLFKPYIFDNIDIESSSTSPIMSLSQDSRKKLEKFYTKNSVVKLCMSHVKSVFKKLKITTPHLLEPSAGSGVFIDEFENFTYDAYDISPESPLIKQADFLKKNTNEIITNTTPDQSIVVIGNPPYKLAIKFINKCAELNVRLICFVLPNVFKKPTIINKLNRYYHLIKQEPLPKNAFLLGDVDYDVPSSFFIFVKKSNLRPLIKLDVTCVGYKYVPFKSLTITDGVIVGADISIIRVGGRAGKAFLTSDTSDDALVSKQKYNYFIKLDNSDNGQLIIDTLSNVVWDKNNTTGPRSIGKYELNPILNNITAQI